MTNKQQALEELMAWCEKFDVELHAGYAGEIDLYHRKKQVMTVCWFTPKSIDEELNKVKDSKEDQHACECGSVGWAANCDKCIPY